MHAGPLRVHRVQRSHPAPPAASAGAVCQVYVEELEMMAKDGFQVVRLGEETCGRDSSLPAGEANGCMTFPSLPCACN